MSFQVQDKINTMKPTDLTTTTTTPKPPPYTVFSQIEKHILVVFAASIAFWSSCGSPIYYPALQELRVHFHTTEQLVNVSIVVYMVCQGLSPALLGPLADIFGRRPVLLGSLVVFMACSAGLAVANNYPLLLVLRCIQSCAISPSVAISAGIAGDYTERHERGWFVGLVTGLALLGQAFGTIIGAGLMTGFGSWRAIFWFLVIGGGVTLVLNVFFLPETKRSIVGNGSITPDSWTNRAPILYLNYYKDKWSLRNPDYSTAPSKAKPDYLTTFKIVLMPEVALCLLTGAIHYAIWVVLLTSLTTQLSDNYNYSIMHIGLSYIPAGVGGLIGSFVAGRAMDFTYHRLLARHNKSISTGSKQRPFNIVNARALVAIPFTIFTDGFTFMFGWCLDKEAHIATILVSEFIVCMGAMAIVGINTTLLVDLYPNNSSAASGAVNLTRCLMGALFVGVLTFMNQSIGIGGTFSVMAGLGLASTALLVVPMKYAMEWTENRRTKSQPKATTVQ